MLELLQDAAPEQQCRCGDGDTSMNEGITYAQSQGTQHQVTTQRERRNDNTKLHLHLDQIDLGGGTFDRRCLVDDLDGKDLPLREMWLGG